MHSKRLKIQPFQSLQLPSEDFFVQAIEERLDELLTNEIKEDILKGSTTELFDALPILYASPVSKSFEVKFLCQAEYMQGVGRYVNDVLSRWLVPGKNLAIIGVHSLRFTFLNLPRHRFFIEQVWIQVEEEEIEQVQRNLGPLLQEIRLNLLAVYHARYISSLRSISLEQKHFLLQENLKKILSLPSSEADQTLFDEIHAVLHKLSSERKMGQVKHTLAQLLQSRPKAFDREFFSEMTHFTVLFREQFAQRRHPKHVSRVIALHYLFKKAILEDIEKNPEARHISFKVFRTNVDETRPVLGVLIAISTLRESERIDKKLLFESIRCLLPDIEEVRGSFISDQREERAVFLYLEVAKPHNIAFLLGEVKILKERLPLEVKKQLESAVHPIFLPRNEEEVARNLILLCQQIRSTRDLSQVSIHYEKQNETELHFTVLIARLLHKQKGMRELIIESEPAIKFAIEELRIVGHHRRKVPKEATILRATLVKSSFFRPDHSVDLLRARQKVAYELSRIIGEYRDFNGGLILKQEESLSSLRSFLGPMSESEECVLEDYFFAIRPAIMQTLLPPEALQSHLALLRALDRKPSGEPYLLLTDTIAGYRLIFVGAADAAFKEWIDSAIAKMNLPPCHLASCTLQLSPITAAGYLVKGEDLGKEIEDAILKGLKSWSHTLYCSLNRAS